MRGTVLRPRPFHGDVAAARDEDGEGFSRAGKDGRDSLQERRLSRRPVRVCSLLHTNAEVVVREFSRIVEEGGFLISFRPVSPLSGSAAPQGMEVLGRDRLEECLPVWFRYRDLGGQDRRPQEAGGRAHHVGLLVAAVPCGRRGCSRKGIHDWRGIGYYLLVARRTNDNQC